jgi:hypothetical protein
MRGARGAEREQVPWAVPALFAAMALAAALLAWEGRQTTFFNGDEFQLFTATSWSPRALLTPLNGHLILVSRFLGHTVLSLFGPEYGVFRGLGVVAVLAASGTFFVYARRRVGEVLALAATIPLLFLGSAWEILLWPIGSLQLGVAIAAGIGAMLLLEDGGRRREGGACALLVLSVASFTVGLCFVAAAATSLALRSGSQRWRRAWIVAVPFVLWVAWWIWSARFNDYGPTASNILLIPVNAATSFAAVLAALTGLTYSFVPGGIFAPPGSSLAWAPVLVVAAMAGLYALARRARPSPALVLPALVALVSYWSLTGLGLGPSRAPDASRYMFPGAFLVLLVAVELARGIRPTRTASVVIFSILALTVATNLAIMREAGSFFRGYTGLIRPQLAMIELAGPNARPDFDPASQMPDVSTGFLQVTAADYLRGVAKFGSFAETPDQVAASDAGTRATADIVLSAALGLQLVPDGVPTTLKGCRVSRTPAGLALPPGGVSLRSSAPASLRVGRFADDPTVKVGSLEPRSWATMEIPVDAFPDPWTALVGGHGRVEACPLRGAA